MTTYSNHLIIIITLKISFIKRIYDNVHHLTYSLPSTTHHLMDFDMFEFDGSKRLNLNTNKFKHKINFCKFKMALK